MNLLAWILDNRFNSLVLSLNAELTNRDNEIQKLTAEAARAKDMDKLVQRQTFDLEQLKKQLGEQQQLNNHADENKIEIRNLQNALDSSKKELEAQRVLVTDYKVKLEDLNKQLSESKQLTNTKASGESFLVSFVEITLYNERLLTLSSCS